MEKNIIRKRIKDIRLAKGITQETLGVRAGLTRSYISLLESGRKIPAIATLYKLSDVLGVNIGYFFEAQSNSPAIVICGEKDLGPVSNNKSVGYGYGTMFPTMKDKIMETFYVKISPGKHKAAFAHKGEEFMHVTKGILKLIYDGKEYILKKGDSAYFVSSKTHKFEVLGDKPVFLISVNVKAP